MRSWNSLIVRAPQIAPSRRGEPVIEKVFYPVFPPDRNAGDVLAWLSSRNGVNRDS